MNIACLMDPIESINPEKDTSYALLKKAQEMGHNVFYLPTNGLSFQQYPISSVLFNVRELSFTSLSSNDLFFKFMSDYQLLTESDIDCVLIRTDPPVNDSYISNTWILDRCHRTVVLNNPTAVRSINEKIWATQFSKLTPTTLITSSIDQSLSFLDKYSKMVVKPINGFGGQSIFILSKDDINVNVTLETVTHHQSQYIICQEYLESAEKGDKRILICNGKPLGAVLRHHSDDDPRNNFFAGGVALHSVINDKDLEIINELTPFFLEKGLFFVGIDIIGDKLIEVNVTSPTCLQEMSDLMCIDLSEKVISEIETVCKN